MHSATAAPEADELPADGEAVFLQIGGNPVEILYSDAPADCAAYRICQNRGRLQQLLFLLCHSPSAGSAAQPAGIFYSQ